MEKTNRPTNQPATKKETSMDYTKDAIDFDEMTAAAKLAESKPTYYIELPTSTGCRLLLVIAFDADTKTGLAKSEFTGQVMAFRVRSTSPCNEMRNVTLFTLRDISLAAGILLAETTTVKAKARCSYLLDICPKSAADIVSNGGWSL
jgi:hypothetical protein